MKRVLLTGGTGLIGSEVIRQMNNEYLIYATSRRPDATLTKKIRLIPCDLSRPFDTDILPPKIDAVIHLAQSEWFRDFPEHVSEVFNVNTATTLRLLDYARSAGAKTFVYASSGGIYGYGDEGFQENHPVIAKHDLGFYLSTKLSSEILAENYSGLMNVIMLRFFFVYGPDQKPSMLIPRLINSVRDGTPITLQGETGIRINPTYVSDAAAAVIRSLDLIDSQKINVGGPDTLSLREIGTIIGEVVGRDPVFSVDSSVQPRHLIGDIGKMESLLRAPEVRFRDGVSKLVAGTAR